MDIELIRHIRCLLWFCVKDLVGGIMWWLQQNFSLWHCVVICCTCLCVHCLLVFGVVHGVIVVDLGSPVSSFITGMLDAVKTSHLLFVLTRQNANPAVCKDAGRSWASAPEGAHAALPGRLDIQTTLTDKRRKAFSSFRPLRGCIASCLTADKNSRLLDPGYATAGWRRHNTAMTATTTSADRTPSAPVTPWHAF